MSDHPRLSVPDRINYGLIKRRKHMKKLHDARRAAKVCIQNAAHGAAHKGGRCKPCWDKKLRAERDVGPPAVAA